VILIRAVGFVLFAGIIFSLTPSLAIHRLALSSSAFGLLLGCIGAGALLATAFLPTLRARLAPHTLLTLFTVVFALSLVVLAFVKSAVAVGAALFVCGAGWLSVLSTFNTAVQLSVPSWVRARAFGAYITCWGGMAVGAALWGAVAERAGLPATFAAAAAGMLAAHGVLGRLRIEALYHDLDLAPIRDYPHPPEAIAPDAGPILVQLAYAIAPADVAAFREAMRGIRRIRVRDGALSWSLFEEVAPDETAPRTFVESYFSSSWGEHLLQHHRATLEDREILAAAYRLTPEEKPRVKHLVAAWRDGG
jgi:MFS family permease